jgi:hypothetical protein
VAIALTGSRKMSAIEIGDPSDDPLTWCRRRGREMSQRLHIEFTGNHRTPIGKTIPPALKWRAQRVSDGTVLVSVEAPDVLNARE